jgi:ribosomal protein S18 acetylase RimI-like enzyme
MVIRLLNADDAAEWLRLRLEALQCDPEAFSAALEQYQSLSIEEVQRRLWSTPDAFVVGALEQDHLVGMAGFYREQNPKTQHKGRIWGVYVSAPTRGQGVGRKMMDTVLKRAAAIAGLDQLLLSVTSTQSPALALYRSLGCEEFGTEPRALYVNGRFIDELYMTLRLTRTIS